MNCKGNSQSVSEYMSRVICHRKAAKSKYMSIAAYPQNDARELARIMADIQVDCLPVFFSPWNKKLIGFIELNKLKVLMND